MLNFYFLNVGHGSSVIVEVHDGVKRVYGVIDSNRVGSREPRTLTKLRELGAQELSFLCLTHPHVDHFNGLFEVVLAFPNAIRHFYSCPFGDLCLNRNRLRKLASKLKKIANSSDGMT